ncbi:MAG: hypothetical protein JW817_02310 [Clostridiales bacterium]|nr:hypothetical protein [Clostridiales bacterium]
MKMHMKSFFQLTAIIVALAMVLSSCLFLGGREDRPEETRDAETKNSADPVMDDREDSSVDNRESPEEALVAFLEALRASDFEAVSEQSDGVISEEDLIHGEWPISRALFEATFGEMTWTIGEKEMLSGTAADIEVSVCYPDHFGAADEVVQDKERMVEVTRPVVLYYAQRTNEREAFLEYSNQIAEYVVGAIGNTEIVLAAEDVFRLKYDDAEQVWRVIRIPECFLAFSDFYSFDPMNRSAAEDTLEILMTAAAELFEEGEIERVEYEALLTGWLQMAGPPEYSVEEIRDAVDRFGWYDIKADRFVEEYDKGAEAIFLRIYFDRAMMGLVLDYEVFRGDTSMGGSSVMMLDEKWVTIGINGNPGFPADTFRVVVCLPDGSVLADSSVEIKGS